MIKLENITVVTAIVALVKAVKMYVPALDGILTVLLAAVLGGVAGYLNIGGVVDIPTGVVLGLSAVGAVSVADRISGK